MTTIIIVNIEYDMFITDLPGCGMVGPGCTARCSAPKAFISTDRFPAEYREGDSCVWTIEGSFGQYVELEIDNLDVPDDDDTCVKAFVAIYDTDLKGEEHLIGRYCKDSKPHGKILSRWQTMKIEFRAGSAITGRGFKGRYSIVNFTQTYGNTTNSGKTETKSSKYINMR